MTNNSPYQTIDDIRLRKAMLLSDIQKDSAKLSKEWHSLFHKPVAMSRNATPGKRINSLLNSGAGIIDAFLLGWKLYRKFKR